MVNKERMVEEFIELVSIPCPSKDERAEAELIMKKMRELGLEPEMDNAGEKCGSTSGNVWATLKGNKSGAPRIFFEAHMDQVTPATGTKVVRRDGVLYSDGTTTLGGDDKVGIETMLELVRVLQEDNIPHGDVQLCCTIGEEIGCLGAVNMDKSKLAADFGYSLDMDGKTGGVVYGAPMLLDIYVTVKGKSAHAGVCPEKGINAINIAAKAIASLPAYGRLDEETTLSIGMFHGGDALNIVCPEVKFTIDMRCPNVPKLERLRDETLAQIKSVCEANGATVEFDVVVGCPAVSLSPEHQACQLAAKAAENLGFTPSMSVSGGCSDANYICGYGVPTAVLATGMSNIHTCEEYLAEEDLYNTARWAVEIVRLAAE